MKRDLQPAKANWATMARHGAPITTWPTAGHSKAQAPRAMLGTAVHLLLMREMSRDLLAERLQERYPNSTIHIDNIVARLIAMGYVDGDGADQLLLGLTDAGDIYARSLPPEPATTEHSAARHDDGLADNARQARHLLTRSPVRGVASPADLRTAPMRPGSDKHECHPSRIGDRYHYRDGRVTELDGTEVALPHIPRDPGRNTARAL